LASFYEGTPLSEFKLMPLDELQFAVDMAENIAKEREKASKG